MIANHFVLRLLCPGCQSTESRELYSADYTEPPIADYLTRFYTQQGGVEIEYLNGVHFVLNECSKCGLIFQKYVPDEFLSSKLYEQWIDPTIVLTNKANNDGIEYFSGLAQEVQAVLRHLSTKPHELNLFDFGMGWGDWCRMAIAHGCKAFGSEISESRIRHARSFGVSIVSWEDIPKYQFDFINADQVFEHIAEPLSTLKYLSSSLKSKGVIMIGVPDGWDINRRLEVMDWNAPKSSHLSLNAVAPLEHINCFNQHSLTAMACKADLVPVEVDVVAGRGKGILDVTIRDMCRTAFRAAKRLVTEHRFNATRMYFAKRQL
jgi:2-polyprenyl-3-methyl-5-hydroxy-6-metoxy-1,4-benzoquinol methylase